MAKSSTLKAEAERRQREAAAAANSADPSKLTLEEYIAAKRAQKGSKLSPTNLKIIKEQWNAAQKPSIPADTGTWIDEKGFPNVGPKPVETKKESDKGIKSGTPAGEDLITKTNAALADLAKPENATNYINGLTDDARLALAKQLIRAGQTSVPESGKYNRALVEAYITALGQAQAENTFNKSVKDFIPHTLDSFLNYAADLRKGSGTGAPDVKAYISDRTTAAGIINGVINRELGRAATALEIDTLTKALNAYEKSNPYVTSKTSRTGGVDQAEYVRQLVTGMTSLKDKAGKKIADSLAKEFTTKKSDKTQLALDGIKATAVANGYDLDQATLDTYANRIKNGEDPDAIKKSIRNIMAAHYEKNKGVADLLKAGTDLAEIALPYKNTMAQILEVNPNQISLNDPLLSSAIGTEGNMPLYQFKQALRKDPRWQYTDNARQSVSESVLKVLQDFGFKG